MPKITRVYTRSGDDGSTSLGSHQRVKKYALRVSAYGTVDELNSFIGVAMATGLDGELLEWLGEIQNELFHLGADLCVTEDEKEKMPVPKIGAAHVERLEKLLDDLTGRLGPLENFILPGGSRGAAHLHVARAVCRRAERIVAELADREPVGPSVLTYLNRLSDALFVMARYENQRRGVTDVYWDSRR